MTILLYLFFFVFIVNYLILNVIENIILTKKLSYITEARYKKKNDICINNWLITLNDSFFGPSLSYRETRGCNAITASLKKCSGIDYVGDLYNPCRFGLLYLMNNLNYVAINN